MKLLKALTMKKHFTISPIIFYPTALISLLFVTIVIIFDEQASMFFANFQMILSDNLGWLINLCINFYLVIIIYIGLSRFGSIRLGGNEVKPEFSTFAWASMLFSAGMGIGLVYFGVAEPMFHYINPISTTLTEPDKIRKAMHFTFFHYGPHVWGIYCLVALALAYYCFNKKRTLSLSSTLMDIVPKRLSFLFSNSRCLSNT